LDTIRAVYDQIIKAMTQTEADEQLAGLIRLMVKEGKSPRQAKKIAKKNIGYWAGYYDEETARRIWRLFRTEHPVFGKRWPGPREAFQLGVKLGRKHA
jgi:hypothetical protein